MNFRSNMAKSIVLAGIPLLTFPLLAESGEFRDRSQRDNGGRSFSNQRIVQGEIFRKNGDEITLRSRHGERIRFRINDQTNQLCPQGTQASQTSSMNKGSSGNQGSSMGQGSSSEESSGQSQMAEGRGQSSSDTGQVSSSSLFGSQNAQASSQGSNQGSSGSQNNPQQSQQKGFSFGECNFRNGEFVKAKVDEDGNATFVRSMGQNDENYFNAGRSGEDYFVLPAGQLGGLDISDKEMHYSVKSSDGKEIGEVHRTMTNGNGDLTYAIIKKKDGQLISVPWQALEGAGNKTFKLQITQNQLGNLPILEEGENAGTHVKKHWDLTEQEQKNLAKRNERMDDFYQTRDRYYEDTPTFEGNREGYSRYGDRQRSVYDYDYRDDNRARAARAGVAGEEGVVSMFGSPSTLPPNRHAPQYEGADREGSFDRNRREGRYDDDFRHREDRRSIHSQGRQRYDENSRDRSDRYQTTTRRSKYDPQREGADRYQSRRSGGSNYDYRPEQYRP